MKKMLKVVLMFIMSVLVIVLCYVGYVMFTYYRIEDKLDVEIVNNQSAKINVHEVYTIQTYNIGFGAYNHAFSFFMDSGEMLDGTKVNGKNGKAESRDVVLQNVDGATALSVKSASDFYLFQEVDIKADRSFKVNQKDIIMNSFSDYSSTFAYNFHSAFLAYPFTDMHGKSDAGLLNLSKYYSSASTRYQYIIDMSFPYKYMDLDRCFLVNRYLSANGKELVIVNSHMSAYDAGGKIRAQQLAQLNALLEKEYAAGNYVIVGGDFNHDLVNSIDIFESAQKQPAWVASLSNADLNENYHIVEADNYKEVPTCRSTDMPYTKNVNYTVVIDGFIVSNNIKATAINIDNDFTFSDHNPVVMSFELME